MDLQIGKELNYDLYTNQERAEQVKQLFTPEKIKLAELHYDEATTQHELEKIANFILYGKDPKNDKNFVQKKEIQIDSAKSSFKRKEPESLDAILEDPLSKETDLSPVHKSIYKKVKPTISRDPNKADAKIPGMLDLWKAIDKLDLDVKELKKQEKLNLEYYKKRHLLISLRQQQYSLKESVQEIVRANCYFKSLPPAISFTGGTGYWKDYDKESFYFEWKLKHYGENYYRSKEYVEKKREEFEKNKGEYEWVELSENFINFENKEHIYHLLENYSTLIQRNYEDFSADAKYLYWELDEYIEKAALDKSRELILIRKIDKIQNEQIRQELVETMGLGYSENYISTIYMGICEKIAKAAQLSKKEFLFRNKPEMWKVCSHCQKTLLKDLDNFTKRRSSADGLNSKCKSCEKKIRDEKKGGISNE